MGWRLWAWSAAILAAAAPAAAQPPDAPSRQVDEVFRSWATRTSPGCAVGIAQDGRVLRTAAFGMADLEHDVPLTAETVFEAGSVSKQFTAAAILLLVQDGRLSLSDEVHRYVPELPRYDDPITIEQLLGHTSGLRDWGSVADIEGWPRTTRAHSNSDALAIIARQGSLNYRPGTEYSYTNSGYTLLAIIVERVSGRSLAQFTRERIFVPLGMRSTSWRDDFRRIVPGRAIAYAPAGSGWEQQMPFENAYGNGGLLTTVGDLLRWNDALTNGLLGADLTRELERRARLNDGREIAYARGLVHERFGGAGEISHAGATGAYRAWLGRYPGERLSVALLCNAANVDAAAIARRVASLFASTIIPSAPAAVQAEAAPYAGLWVNMRSGAPLRLEDRGGTLAIVDGELLRAIGASRFAGRPGVLAFSSADAFTLETREGEEVEFRRVAQWAPTAEQLQHLPGFYRSVEAPAIYEIRAEADGLVLRHLSRPEIVHRLRPAQQDVFEYEGGSVRVVRFGVTTAVSGLSFRNARVRDLEFHRFEPPAGLNEVQAALGNAEFNIYFLAHCERPGFDRSRHAPSLRRWLERLTLRAYALYGGAYEHPIVMPHPTDAECEDRRYARRLRQVREAFEAAERALAGPRPY